MQIIVCLRPSARVDDCPALRTALAVRDALADGSTVCVVSIGGADAEHILSDCTACGADSAYLLNDPAFDGADSHATARVLQAFVTKVVNGPYLVFCQENDPTSSDFVVPARLAGMLGTEQFYYVKDVSVDSEGVACLQDYSDLQRSCRVSDGSVMVLDAVDAPVSVSKVRDPLEVSTMDRIALGLGMYSVGKAGSRTEIVSKGVE